MSIDESKVREMAGVLGGKYWIQLTEGDGQISIEVGHSSAEMTVDAARKLARQLDRLARRVEVRGQPQ